MVEITEHFSTLEDPRIDRTRRHDLMDIIVLAICAVICGADGWDDIEEFGEIKYDWLKTFLLLPNGIPSADTIRRVFSAVDPEAFQRCFMSWVQSLAVELGGTVVAIDGKTLRRSFDRARGKAALHMISAWSAEYGLTLGQLATEEKSNEITAIPKLLELLELKGAIVTIDAMGTQKKIAEAIVHKGADYVLQLKANQTGFYEEVSKFFEWARTQNFKDVPVTVFESTDGEHGRIEVRKVWCTPDINWFSEKHLWINLKRLVMVERERTIGEKTQFERSFYISSLDADAKRQAKVIRSHWSIENNLHWVLDVTFKEDLSRIHTGHGPDNFALLRKFALALLKREKTSKRGIAARRKRASWDDNYLLTVLSALDV